MGFFKTTKITDLNTIKLTDEITESDYSIITKDNKFIQFQYIEDEQRKAEPYIVTPGVWSIQKSMSGYFLQETAFFKDELLNTYSYTQDIKKRIKTFFDRFYIYTSKNRLPIRRFLLYGPAGSGKSSIIVEAIEDYTKDNKTATIIWHTDKFEAYQVKDFIQSFDYKDVDKQIVVIEDIGGVERDEGRRPSESSLLSLLDNTEKTFTIPTLILATTNHPETLLGNLTNRPGRFSDKIEVTFPKPDERLNLLKFFYKGELSEAAINIIKSSKTDSFTPDHIKNIVDNSELYDKLIEDAIDDMVKEIAFFNKAFSKTSSMGSFYDE